MSLGYLFVLVLATWRLSYILVKEDGPWNFVALTRYKIGVRYDQYSTPYGENTLADLLTCVWCTSVWVGAALAAIYLIAPDVAVAISLPFALSAGAIIVNSEVENE